MAHSPKKESIAERKEEAAKSAQVTPAGAPHEEHALDDALVDTFPASDPIAVDADITRIEHIPASADAREDHQNHNAIRESSKPAGAAKKNRDV